MVAAKRAIAPFLAVFALGLLAASSAPSANQVKSHLRSAGVDSADAPNTDAASAYWWLAAPASAAAAPLLERFGAGRIAISSSIGILAAVLLWVVAVRAHSVAVMLVGQCVLGIAGELHGNTFYAFLTRWYGTGATLWFAVFAAFHQIGKIFAIVALPVIASKQGLYDAMLLLAVIQLFMVFATSVLNAIVENVEVKNEVRAERIKRPEVMAWRSALTLVPPNAWLLSCAAAFHFAGFTLLGIYGAGAWQSVYGLSSNAADTIECVITLAFCLGALATGITMELRYRPREMLVATATVFALVAMLIGQSSANGLTFVASLLGCFCGAFRAVQVTTLSNLCPRYSHIVYAAATSVAAAVTLLAVIVLDHTLLANELPPCPPRHTPRPGSSHTAAPDFTPFPCSDQHQATADGNRDVLHVIGGICAVGWILTIASVVVDARGERVMGRRVAGDSDTAVVEQEVELEDVLVRRSVILGGDPALYGTLETT